jgi:long-chain acyl-CoA synthetase
MNIAKNLENAARQFPDNMALMADGGQLTYRQFNTAAVRIAGLLRKKGVKPGSHIGLFAPNSPAWLCFYFGVLKTGAVAVTLPHAMTGAELKPVLADCEPEIIFTDDTGRPVLEDLSCPAALVLKTDTMFDPVPPVPGSEPVFSVERHPDDVAAILYTGGTTGVPKGVMLTHRNIMTSAFNVSHNERSCETDRALCFLPLNHVFAQMHIMNATVFSAGGLVIQPSFNMDALLKAVADFGVTKLYAVPTVYIRLLSLPDIRERLGTVRYCFSAAASMAKEVVREWKARTGLDINEAYGMTESASMVSFNHYHRHVIGSVGTPAPNVEIQIRDEQGRVLPPNREGEICIAGPNIMKGYLNRPEDTETAFWGRWFRSGDIGYLDDDNYLFIVDRIKELIITGGENVSPREIEEILYTRHEIEECAVIGLPDREYGERVTAYIVYRPGRSVDPGELKSYLKTRLSPFKVPKAFVSVKELPKSSTGKLLKRELKRQVLKG